MFSSGLGVTLGFSAGELPVADTGVRVWDHGMLPAAVTVVTLDFSGRARPTMSTVSSMSTMTATGSCSPPLKP